MTGEPVEYATAPRRGEAARGLARWLGCTEDRAADLLDSGEAVAEIRARQRLTGRQARRELERRLPDPSLLPGG